MQKFQNGYNTKETFTHLVEQYEKPLYYFIRRLSSASSEEVEDVVQETFITAWKYINSYDPTFSIKVWLYRIARQQTIRAFRKRRARGGDAVTSTDILDLPELADSLDLPEEMHNEVTSTQVQECLQMLAEDQRSVLLLRYSEDMSYEEISDIMKKPVGTVSTLVHRAKNALEQSIQRHYPHLANHERTL